MTERHTLISVKCRIESLNEIRSKYTDNDFV